MGYGKKVLRPYTSHRLMHSIADTRTEMHCKQRSHRPLGHHDTEYLSMVGEDYFGAYAGYPIDLELKEFGDGGIDYDTWEVGTVDVKTLVHPYALLVEYKEYRKHPLANILVLCGYSEKRDEAYFRGWATGAEILGRPHWKHPMQVDNHEIVADKLHPIEELWQMFDEAHGYAQEANEQLVLFGG